MPPRQPVRQVKDPFHSLKNELGIGEGTPSKVGHPRGAGRDQPTDRPADRGVRREGY
jgi:hypothetical protein